MTLFLLLAMALVVLAVLFPFFLQWLAQENVLLTTVKEGTVKAIMHGDSLHRFIMAFEGYHINEPKKKWHKSTLPNWRKNFVPDWQVLYHGPGNKNEFDFKKHDDDYYDDRHWLLKRLGLYWVGWPWKAKVYVYEFEWNEVITRDEGGNQILARADATDFIYVSDFTYGILTEEAKTKAPKENLPIKVLTLVTVAVRNPYRALFSGEDWLWRVTAAINRHVRSFVGTKKYAELITPSGDIAKAVKGKDFSAPIIALTKRLFDDTPAKKPLGLAGRYGKTRRESDIDWWSGHRRCHPNDRRTRGRFSRETACGHQGEW